VDPRPLREQAHHDDLLSIIDPMRRALLIVLGLVFVLPLVYLDPAAIVLLDAEFLVATVTVAVSMTRTHVRWLWHRVLTGDTAAFLRGAWHMTRLQPRSAWDGLGAFS
jgi:hypothetical protein